VADALECAFWSGDAPLARAASVKIGREYGQSFWLVEARIALLQSRLGLEAQKRFTERLLAVSKSGLLAYIAHCLSIRNEPSSTAGRYTDTISRRIDSLKVDPHVRTYLLYRLTHRMPLTKFGVANVLHVDQGNSIIDLYESLISIAQACICGAWGSAVREPLQRALSRLSGIADWRLSKIRFALGITTDQPAVKVDEAFAFALAGQYRPALRAALRQLRRHPTDALSIALAAWLSGHGGPLTQRSAVGQRRWAISRLSAGFARTGNSDQAFSDVSKFGMNFSFFPIGRAIHSLVLAEGMPRSALIGDPWKLLVLNVPVFRSLDYVILAPSIEKADYWIEQQRQGKLEIVRKHKSGQPAIKTSSGGQEYVFPYVESRLTQYVGVPSKALAIGARLLTSAPEPLIASTARLVAECYLDTGDFAQALSVISKFGARNENARRSMPIREAVGSSGWQQLEPYSGDMSLPIVLDMLSRDASDDSISTLKRFAFEEFLSRKGFDTPIELSSAASEFEAAELIYFLRHVCVTSVMDMSAAFNTSRQLDEERRKICGWLCELDRANSEIYGEEIFNISSKLAIQDGLRVVDRSRVHVDVDAISRWAQKELRESFLRYVDLVRSGLGVADDLDSVLRAIYKRTESSKSLLSVPDSEADDLLIRIVLALRDEFLFDTAHGLDSYLSKRVRHGSIPNHLRSPVEDVGLVTQRDSSTDTYKPNEGWLSRLTRLNEGQRNKVDECFTSFSRAFDGIIFDLKDRRLQIKSNDHLDGLFEILLPTHSFHIIRSTAQVDFDFESFLRSCYTFFWARLEVSLRAAREHLRVHTKAEFARAFETLRAGLLVHAEHDPAFPELSMAVGTAASSVQSQVDSVAEWFHRAGITDMTLTYTFEQVIAIAIASAKNAMRSFRPEIVTEADTTLKLPPEALVRVTEVIWVALDNVRQHSGMAASPWIRITGSVDRDKELISVQVVSQVAEGTRTADKDEKLRSLRETIAAGTFRDRVRREGNSGFLKIASFVRQASRGDVRFGFMSEEEFFVQVDMPIVIYFQVDDGRAAA
jgi:hypothetical protein